MWVTVFTVPILILGFNRPDLLLGLVNSIRNLKPTKILVAIDGPRFDVENESDLVEQCRSIVDEIDWSCEISTLFRESNLGCGQAVSKAIEWAFTIVDEIIVLEDDVRPSLDFLNFVRLVFYFTKMLTMSCPLVATILFQLVAYKRTYFLPILKFGDGQLGNRNGNCIRLKCTEISCGTLHQYGAQIVLIRLHP